MDIKDTPHPEYNVTHAQLVSGLMKGPNEILGETTPQTIALVHAALGMAGEVGEVQQSLKAYRITKMKFPPGGRGNGPIREARHEIREARHEIVKELGDYEFYLQNLYQVLGVERVFPQEGTGAGSVVRAIAELSIDTAYVVDTIKKCFAYNRTLNYERISARLIAIEVWLYHLRAAYCGYEDEVRHANIAKLLKRFPDAVFTNERAIGQADEEKG